MNVLSMPSRFGIQIPSPFALARRLVSHQQLARLRRPAWLGTLRQTRPLSDAWGYDRGTPVDRYYIEQFLDAHRADIRGRVLEIKDSSYTDQFGVGVERADILDISADNPRATLIADLTQGQGIPSNLFDCFILTQTLQFIYDTRAALENAHRILKPGGVLLATLPALSKLDRRLTDYWRFTPASCALLFGEVFGRDQVTVQSYGNVLSGVGFLTGMATEEFKREELAVRDERFPLIVGVRAVKRMNQGND